MPPVAADAVLVMFGIAIISLGTDRAMANDGYSVEPWRQTLADYQHQGGLDYGGLAGDRDHLDRYLQSLATARPGDWSTPERLSFWSNAYNAVVAKHVLDRYPDIKSVKDVEGFFDELTFPVAGREMTLDEIEGAARSLGDPRVHFAVVCASTSCPDLLPFPFEGHILDEQLQTATQRFLNDRDKGLKFDLDAKTLYLSSIFKWYAGDFTGGSTALAYFARGGVLDWVLDQLPSERAAPIREVAPKVRYMDYDWHLNDRPK